MTQLIKYEAARQALTDAVMFDEVMSIMNVAEQAALYAKQANDNELVEKATEIRVRAQRKAGEMLAQAGQSGQRAGKSDGGKRATAERWGSKSIDTTSHVPTLADIGVTKDQSSHWQSLASMSEEHFETAVETAKATAGEVTTAFMLREAKQANPPKARPLKGKKAEAMREQLKAAQARPASQISSLARLLMKELREQVEFTEQERHDLTELHNAIASATSN